MTLDDIVVGGIGATQYLRISGRSVVAQAFDAALAALGDAGVDPAAVDGLVPVGGGIFADEFVSGLGVREDVRDALPAPGGNSALNGVAIAEAMIRSGRATVVLLVFARNGSSGNRIANRVRTLPGDDFRAHLERPYGWVSPVQWYAMIARRHMIEFGTTKQAMAEVALAARAHAQLNPHAMTHGRPLTPEQYFSAPVISDPYQRWDCCLETDGAVALVLTTRGRVPSEKRTRAATLLAVATSRPSSPDDLTNRPDWFEIGLTAAAPKAFHTAGLAPEEVDTAMIYDCFTFEVLHQLEEAGFCDRGGAAQFVQSGAIGLAGALPVNPSGGMLAEGHLGGLSHMIEAVRQVRGEAGPFQVDGARVAAVTGWGDWGDGSLALVGASR